MKYSLKKIQALVVFLEKTTFLKMLVLCMHFVMLYDMQITCQSQKHLKPLIVYKQTCINHIFIAIISRLVILKTLVIRKRTAVKQEGTAKHGRRNLSQYFMVTL